MQRPFLLKKRHNFGQRQRIKYFVFMSTKMLFILAGPLAFFLILLLGTPTGMPEQAYMVFASTVWIAIWWVSEAVPIPITSLLPLVLFPLTGAMSMNAVAEPYSRKIIFLFLGGFLLALAMQRWRLDRRIALRIIALTGTNMRQVILGFILATYILSMWIPNTATTMMLLPIALSVIVQFRTFDTDSGLTGDNFGKALVLSIAYTASIGGLATLVGTPTNLIFADAVKKIYEVDIPFDQFMWFGFPISFILMLLCWWHLTRNAFKLSNKQVEGAATLIREELQELGAMKPEEKIVLGVFLATAFAWMSRRYLINPFFPKVDDINIALIAAISLFLIPAPSKPNTQLMDWQTSLKLPWGVILLFGGAFAVAAGFEASGLTAWIGEQLSGLSNYSFWMILIIIITLVIFLTEVTQNMATCTLMMPIMAALSEVLNVHPFAMMASICVTASCAFMLPVATAPNAIVFGSGFLKIKDMARAGFLLNIMAIITIFLCTYYLIPFVWGIELMQFPVELKK